MNKKMRDLLEKINSKKVLAKSFMEEDTKDIKKANALLDEIDTLEEEYKAEERLYNLEKEQNAPSDEELDKAKKSKTTNSFAKSVRALITKTYDGNSEGSDDKGGYTVPQDIVTKVEKLREVEESLIDLVTVKSVKTLSGRETYKKKGEYTGFTSIGEGGKIPKKDSPKFSKLDWKVTKYGGYLPVTNELLEDSDEDIEAVIIDWLANESRVTRNNIILAVIKTKEKTDLKDMDGIKKAVTVTLGSAYKDTSIIVTNDDGLNYLDTLKDSTGRPLLNPNPTNNANLALRCGTVVVPIKSYSNKTIPSDGTKAPFIIGNLKEAIKFFDRKQLSLMVSNTAVVGSGDDALNAYEDDLTLIRGIEREDAQMRDEEALVNGYIDLASVNPAIVG